MPSQFSAYLVLVQFILVTLSAILGGGSQQDALWQAAPVREFACEKCLSGLVLQGQQFHLKLRMTGTSSSRTLRSIGEQMKSLAPYSKRGRRYLGGVRLNSFLTRRSKNKSYLDVKYGECLCALDFRRAGMAAWCRMQPPTVIPL